MYMVSQEFCYTFLNFLSFSVRMFLLMDPLISQLRSERMLDVMLSAFA